MKGNPIINKRIEHFKKRKEALLKMKKTERRDELKTVDDTIARLKRWNRELESKKRSKEMKEMTRNMSKACQGTVKAVKSLSDSLKAIGSDKSRNGHKQMIFK